MGKDNPATIEIDYDKLGAAINKTFAASVGTAMAEANKPLIESLSALKPPAAATEGDAKGNATGQPLTLEAVTKMFDERLNSATKNAQAKAERDAYVGGKLKDLPAAYGNQLGNDPTKWAAEEQVIREQFKTDLAAAGVKPKQLGNAAAEGGTTAEKLPVDLSKLSGVQLIDLAVRQGGTPQQGPTQPGQDAAAGATTNVAATTQAVAATA